jgi:hypothetical protein
MFLGMSEIFLKRKVSGRSVSREDAATERHIQMKSKYVILSAIMALAGFLPQGKAQGTLGSAESFAVLGGSTVTSVGNTIITGDLGVSPGISITGFYPPGIVNGTIYNNDPVAAQAEADTLTAYNNLAGEPVNTVLTGQDLGALLLTPGVYFFSSSAQLTGTLTLSGNGYFVFQIGSTLTTASSSSILLINGAQADDVFWQVGSSATLGDSTSFYGSILANASITLDPDASILSGRALAINGGVSLSDNNIVTVPVPEPGSFGLLAFCAFVFGAGRRLAGWQRKAGRS